MSPVVPERSPPGQAGGVGGGMEASQESQGPMPKDLGGGNGSPLSRINWESGERPRAEAGTQLVLLGLGSRAGSARSR